MNNSNPSDETSTIEVNPSRPDDPFAEDLHQPGELVANKYKILATLGRGGVGTTYEAEDVETGERVALKALSLRRMDDWKQMELFEREARILAQLNHPNIPRYLDYFQVDTPDNRLFYIVEQIAPGASLADLVQNGWRTNEAGVRKIAEQVLEILRYLHDLKPVVVHRDIKPQNLVMNPAGQVFLVDFGAVQDTYYSTFMRGSTMVGTYGYMAPEQFRGQAVAATDLYALGATVLFLLTHRTPTDLPQDRLKINFRSRIQVSDAFADWLEKLLEPDVEDRFSSAKEALDVLRGKRVMAGKLRPTVPWRFLLGASVAGLVGVAGVKLFKYPLSALARLDPNVCASASAGDMDMVRSFTWFANQSWLNNLIANHDNKAEERQEFTPSSTRIPGEIHGSSQRNGALSATALLSCAGSKEVVDFAIAHGAKINGLDSERREGLDSWIPLNSAILRGSKEVVELLLAYGAAVNPKTADESPLEAAARIGSKEMAELLIAHGADVNQRGQEFPLIKALFSKNKDTIKLLIANGANVNVRQKSSNSSSRYAGLTALHLAAAFSDREVVELLIAKGAEINSVNIERTFLSPPFYGRESSYTPLDVAWWRQIASEAAGHTNPNHPSCSVLEGHGYTSQDNQDASCRVLEGHRYTSQDSQDSREIIELLKRHGAKRWSDPLNRENSLTSE